MNYFLLYPDDSQLSRLFSDDFIPLGLAYVFPMGKIFLSMLKYMRNSLHNTLHIKIKTHEIKNSFLEHLVLWEV
mgnify:CR=1 FL=1